MQSWQSAPEKDNCVQSGKERSRSSVRLFRAFSSPSQTKHNQHSLFNGTWHLSDPAWGAKKVGEKPSFSPRGPVAGQPYLLCLSAHNRPGTAAKYDCPGFGCKKDPRKSGAYSLYNFSSIAQRGSAIRVQRHAGYFLAMAATSAAKSFSLFARPPPFSKRTKVLMERVAPSSLALASTYLLTEVLFSLTKA